MKKTILGLLFLFLLNTNAQTYSPQAGIAGSTAIIKSSPLYVAWANGIIVNRGLINKSEPTFAISGNNYASFGLPNNAVGFPDGNVVSLGDEGNAILTFATPIVNGNGYDFAVFENASFDYLELAFVEVSSDGLNYFRFPAHSQTQTATQVDTFATPEPTYLNNFAGKYYGDYGTPFDLSEIPNNPLLDKNNIQFVKIVDVVGSINPLFASFDIFGNAVNESFPTPFASCGFDLQAVGVINQRNLSNESFKLNSNIVIFPNPANDYITVKSENTIEKIKILDLNGRIVFQSDNNSETNVIDIKYFLKGIYFLKIESNENISIYKILKK